MRSHSSWSIVSLVVSTFAISSSYAAEYLDSARNLAASQNHVKATDLMDISQFEAKIAGVPRFWTYTFGNRTTADVYYVQLDEAGRQVDGTALLTQDGLARRALYGPMTPAAYSAMNQMAPNTPAQWVISVARPANTPDFRANASPFAYKSAFVAPMLASFRSQLLTSFPDSAPVIISGSFEVTASLNKAQVQTLAGWSNVQTIDLNTTIRGLQVGGPIYLQTQQLNVCHNTPLTVFPLTTNLGQGVVVGVVEVGAWRAGAAFLPSVTVLHNGAGTDPRDDDHAQAVVGLMSDTNSQSSPGGAPGISVVFTSTDFTPLQAISDVLSQPAQMINLSWEEGFLDAQANFIPLLDTGPAGRFADESVYDTGIQIFAGAGNRGNSFQIASSPASGMNVMAVGMLRDNGTGGVADDYLSSDSSWQNPPSYYGTREKPDFLATGDPVMVIDFMDGSGASLESGTSFATPIAASTAALAMQAWAVTSGHSVSSPFYAESMRSVLAVAATHDLDFTTKWLGEYDGAGELDAFVARTVVVNNQFAFHPITACASPGNRVNLATITLQANKRARVAISYSAIPPSGSQLYVPNRSYGLFVAQWDTVNNKSIHLMAGSNLPESTTQLVEFTPTVAGAYEIQATYGSCVGAGSTYLGYAWWQEQ